MLSTRSGSTRSSDIQSSSAQTTGARSPRIGAVDWVVRGVAGLLLVATSACAGPGAVPPAAGTGIRPVATAAAATASAGTDGAPLDPDATPGAGVPGSDAAGVEVAGADVAGAAPQQPALAGKALTVLATLPVKGRAPKTGYSRDQFGPAWSDVDRNGCDTRNDVLRRDLTSVAFRPGTRNCVVLSGVLADPYTAAAIHFLRGNATSTAVQIDHVVALSDAWQKGAQQLSPARRLAFANDPLNLLAVDGPANQGKSDGDAATWLPPNKSYRCDYVARQISVKSSYGLWVTQAEHDAMARVLASCPAALSPANQPAAAPAPAPAARPAPAPAPAPAPVPGVAYANCAAVRAAGAAPIHVGQPGYNRRLDGDGDGVGCE
ncbi:GmrSD restriction endonuclease domain-containing protein [Arthrobacter sp. 131MFCol6.1]|uniref:GmrSD restriction endonuclease domain-containing protein n=1 Tax=Arthrobacter sp. 131MFCol6.1 TaxID=1157944 RepID=UPI00036D89A3|nr:DUF1524 domain-containing protein [Arthrobacter sp. 131MFCol6.1]